MDKLVIGPLLDACDTIKSELHLIVVIDGIDELDASGQTELLDFIPTFISQLSSLPISLLVSSRPEGMIVGAFDHRKLASITRATRLGASDEDIWKFLNDKFDDINLRFAYLQRVHGGRWPSQAKHEIMVRQSSGLFIWPTVATQVNVPLNFHASYGCMSSMCFLVRHDIDFLFSRYDILIGELLEHCFAFGGQWNCPPNANLYTILGPICTALLPPFPKRDEETSGDLVYQFLVQTRESNEYTEVYSFTFCIKTFSISLERCRHAGIETNAFPSFCIYQRCRLQILPHENAKLSELYRLREKAGVEEPEVDGSW